MSPSVIFSTLRVIVSFGGRNVPCSRWWPCSSVCASRTACRSPRTFHLSARRARCPLARCWLPCVSSNTWARYVLLVMRPTFSDMKIMVDSIFLKSIEQQSREFGSAKRICCMSNKRWWSCRKLCAVLNIPKVQPWVSYWRLSRLYRILSIWTCGPNFDTTRNS